MEIGAVFILVVVLIVLAVGGLLLFGVIARMRRKELDPEEDKLRSGERFGEEEQSGSRPTHTRVHSQQRSRFLQGQ